jgi:hypothetical protein
MSTIFSTSKPNAKSPLCVSEENVALTWSNLAKVFPGLIPPLQPALVAIKPKQLQSRRTGRDEKF